ncbi:subtilisin [Fusarium sporotrichioides]|uniref:Subtilisin n=1 Tax=Fusarium sporotrichioides TaxID=5514 RepID=A0A395S2Y3_FUSSP|nr:subtilisin [Fusarium sporotrichioides]
MTPPKPLPADCFEKTTVPCLRALYGIPDDIQPHLNNSFGVFETSWFSWRPEDLEMFFAEYQENLVGHRPIVDAINGGYLQWNLSFPTFYLEPNLDFQYAMALTSPQNVTNVQVGSEIMGNLNNMLEAFDMYYCEPVNQDYQYPSLYPPGCNATDCDCGSSVPPKVLSISWGWTESQFTPNYLQRQCLEFLKLGLMGTTVVVSISDFGTASDRGSYCINDTTGNPNDWRFSPMYPASCPWVTSVGGTQMLESDSRQILESDVRETAWRKNISGNINSSGGGFSNVFPIPPYQVQNVDSYKDIENGHLKTIQDRFNGKGRGYPDVAARANSYRIALNEEWKLVAGTSASTPVFASIITLINSERMHAGKGSVGFINPALYGNPEVLNDIDTGKNGGCGVDPAFRATRGWDAVTGLGSPDYERMRRLFINLP